MFNIPVDFLILRLVLFTCIMQCVCALRYQAHLIAKLTWCKGSSALPERKGSVQTVPDAMHTVKDVIEKIVYLVIGIYIIKPL